MHGALLLHLFPRPACGASLDQRAALDVGEVGPPSALRVEAELGLQLWTARRPPEVREAPLQPAGGLGVAVDRARAGGHQSGSLPSSLPNSLGSRRHGGGTRRKCSPGWPGTKQPDPAPGLTASRHPQAGRFPWPMPAAKARQVSGAWGLTQARRRRDAARKPRAARAVADGSGTASANVVAILRLSQITPVPLDDASRTADDQLVPV